MREGLAALMHEIWCGWRCYVVARSTLNSDGTMTTPAWAVKRWGRQINASYDELSEDEKDSDRKEADKVLALLEKHYRILVEKEVYLPILCPVCGRLRLLLEFTEFGNEVVCEKCGADTGTINAELQGGQL